MAGKQGISELFCFSLWAAAVSLGPLPTLAIAEQPEKGAAQKAESPTGDEKTNAAEGLSNANIDRWIEQLGHDAYALRQAAAEQLLRAGTPARERLLTLAEGPDPEKRAAARRLVALIDRTEFERQLEAFAADTDGSTGLALPGWERFRELAGDDPTARSLFIEMQREEGPLLAAVFDGSSRPMAESWEDRLIQFVRRQAMNDPRGTGASVGTAASMLFLAAVPDLGSSQRSAAWVEHLVQRPPIREILQAGTYREAVRRLLVAWIVNCPEENELLLHRRIYLASAHDLKETVPFALSVALQEGKRANLQPATRALATLLIGHLGGPEHVDRLEPLLEDNTVCVPQVANVPGEAPSNVQIRDVALVAMIGLTDQRPAEYGYVHARMQPQRVYQVQTLHLKNDAQRSEAIAKWRAWRSAERKAESD